jgi:uncharacterized protein YdhG (YjbR/CyaY superfamily)
MAKTSYASVDDYLAAQPDATRDILSRVRDAIRKAIPKAEETISYQIPTYKLGGTTAIYFAGWKEHFSIYPATQTMLASLGDDLAPYKIAKGTIRFELSDPVPVRLISRIAKHRANEVAEKTRVKSAPAKSAPAKTPSAKRGSR